MPKQRNSPSDLRKYNRLPPEDRLRQQGGRIFIQTNPQKEIIKKRKKKKDLVEM